MKKKELELRRKEYREEVSQAGTNMTFEDWCFSKELSKCPPPLTKERME